MQNISKTLSASVSGAKLMKKQYYFQAENDASIRPSKLFASLKSISFALILMFKSSLPEYLAAYLSSEKVC